MPQLLNCVTILGGADAPRVNDLRFPHIHPLSTWKRSIQPLGLFCFSKGLFLPLRSPGLFMLRKCSPQRHYGDVEVHPMDSPNGKHCIGN